MSDDRMVNMQSKLATAMLLGVCKAFKVEPTVPGLLAGMGADPEKVFELVRFVQANGERLTQSFEAAVTGTAARVERMERTQELQGGLLLAIALKMGINVEFGPFAQGVEPAALAPPVTEAAE